jgi:hypothetical protein
MRANLAVFINTIITIHYRSIKLRVFSCLGNVLFGILPSDDLFVIRLGWNWRISNVENTKSEVAKPSEVVFFWCLEPAYAELEGVIDAVVGYAGGRRQPLLRNRFAPVSPGMRRWSRSPSIPA